MPARGVRFVLSLGLLAVPSSVPVPVFAQQPLNLGFERAAVTGEDRPWGWGFGFFAFAGQKAADFSLDDTVFEFDGLLFVDRTTASRPLTRR